MDFQQDYTKTTEQVYLKLEWRIGLSPEQSPSTLGLDMDKMTDFSLLRFLLFSQGIRDWVLMTKKNQQKTYVDGLYLFRCRPELKSRSGRFLSVLFDIELCLLRLKGTVGHRPTCTM